jgi:protein O-mannosyl-transferase
LAALDQSAAAAEHFRAVLQLQPDFAPAHVNLGTMLFKLGRPADAVPHYEAAVRLGYDAPGLRESLQMARQASSGANRP